MGKIPESINYHITQECNYQCKFCFARYHNHHQELSLQESKNLIDALVRNGCKKLNFAGGEPTLIQFLPKLINYAKEKRLFVSLISNGYGITEEFLTLCGHSIDLIGLSIDSTSDITEFKLGRRTRKKFNNHDKFSHVTSIRKKAKLIKKFGIPLKVNTIITPLNWNEDLSKIILELNPIRWKVLEVHYLSEINNIFFYQYGRLETWQFETFITNHSFLKPEVESSEMILESYCMITPDGCFYQDTNHKHNYSKPILKIGAVQAFNQVEFSNEKFILRNAEYFKNLKI